MATRYGLAGQYGKSEALKRQRRMLLWLTAFVALLSAATGFYLGRLQSGMTWIVAFLSLAVFFAVTWYLMRWTDRMMNTLSKERLKFIRGGQTEALVAWILEDIDGNWHVFNSIKLEKQSDIDHVVVGPGGVFCISTKSHRGLFTGTSLGLFHNGQKCDFALNALRQAMNLKERLSAMLGADVPWIQPVLAVPFGYTENDAHAGKVWLVNTDDLCDRIAPEKAKKLLGSAQITRIVKAMEMIQGKAAGVYERPEKNAVEAAK